MVPKILLILLPAALFFAALLIVAIWDRKGQEPSAPELGNGKPEGAFRAFYHALWILIFWSGLVLSLPLWFSYKDRVESLEFGARWVSTGKIIVFPVILLLLLRYGARRGYLKWIAGPQWPDKEND